MHCVYSAMHFTIKDMQEKIFDVAQRMSKRHKSRDPNTVSCWFSPHATRIRLIEVTLSSGTTEEVVPFFFYARPDLDITYDAEIIILSPEEWNMYEQGKLSLPEKWNTNLICLFQEDPRKIGLKNGLRQLTVEQLKKVIEYPGEMVLDEYNYHDGNFCALAIALDLDKTMENPSHDKVFNHLTSLGYSVYNTRGIKGEFYTDNRLKDLLDAAREVLEEKEHAKQQQ